MEGAGYYELSRNWALGGLLSQRLDKPFALVNLVRSDRECQIEKTFGSVVSNRGIFKRLTWEDLVAKVEPALLLHLADETTYFKPAFPALNLPTSNPPVG